MLVGVVTGRIVFLDAQGREWGGERFDVGTHGEERLFSAVSEFRDRGLRRDTQWVVARDGTPREGFVRDRLQGRTVMQSCIRIAGNVAESSLWAEEGGWQQQRVESPRPVAHLGLHSLLADVQVALKRGPTDAGVERPVVCVTASMADYGLGGYGLHVVPPLVTFVGPARVAVRAGGFDAEHYRVRWSDQVPKYSDFWVTPGSFVPLRLLGASGDVSYELEEIS
jgi:hypothetical protein